jgi:hypothetical protein
VVIISTLDINSIIPLDAYFEIPLRYIPMEITVSEGENLIPLQRRLFSLGVKGGGKGSGSEVRYLCEHCT